jgi:nitrate/nitrite-specific signal transduction histidine kinase
MRKIMTSEKNGSGLRPVTALSLGSLLCSCFLFSSASLVTAQTTQIESKSEYYVPGDGSHRINMSGKLRMLSQRIPSMACHQVAGVEVAKSADALSTAKAEFVRIISALEHGDDGLKIVSPENNLKTLHQIALVHDQWDPFLTVVERVEAQDGNLETLHILAEDSGPLLKSAVNLVHRVVDSYFDPVTTLQSDAMTIDFAGRQRMLAQRMLKNMCLINIGTDVELAQTELAEAYRLFDVTLAALQVGMAEAGVSPPPNQAVIDGLIEVAAAWADMAPKVQRVMGGETFDLEEQAAVFNEINDLTAKMNSVVHHYSDAAVIAAPTPS